MKEEKKMKEKEYQRNDSEIDMIPLWKGLPFHSLSAWKQISTYVHHHAMSVSWELKQTSAPGEKGGGKNQYWTENGKIISNLKTHSQPNCP